MKDRVLIKGGCILDGTPTAVPQRRDVLVEDGRIAEIAENAAAADARVLDATGLTVAPGFWDAHAHSDLPALNFPSAQSRVFDGVANEVNGACGSSYFPLGGPGSDRRRALVRARGVEPDWTDAAGYFRAVQARGTAINRGFLAGAGAIRAAVMGYEARPATPDEIVRMKALLAESLDQGALGLSSGLVYPPGSFSTTDELIELCRTLAPTGRPYCTHMRSEGKGLLEAVEEAVAICRESGAPLQISHVKTLGRPNWSKIEALERALFGARERGMDLTADRYPYVATMTPLYAMLPSRFMAGGREKALERLDDPAERRSLARGLFESRQGDVRWRDILVGHVEREDCRFDGLTLEVVAGRMGLEPMDALFELLRRTGLECSAINFDMSEDNLERILRWPFVTIGPDGGAYALKEPTLEGKPHPRSFGTCARFLGRYVRERKLMTLAEGVARLTGMTAKRFGFSDRGILAVGAWADIVVFDPDAILDRATYENPFQLSEGMRHLLVNGTPVLADGAETGARPGRILARS